VTAEIYVDEDPMSPRRDCDCFGVMVCFHRRYDLGDKHDLRSEDFGGWDGVAAHLKSELGAAIVLPLYLYDHSGITMSTGKFSCPWDSGQVGFIYVTKEKIQAEYGEVNADTMKKAEALLESEVEVYDQYLTGDVWGYVLRDYDKEVDSCWGFFGLDYVRKEATNLAEAYDKRENAKTLFGSTPG